MNKFFYGKLAIGNLKKNKGLYLPYFLTAVGMIMVFYIMNAITLDDGIMKMTGAEYVKMILMLGTVVIGIFATIFLFYTNSFLMKRRKKEFGLYNILGMEKRHIARIMFYETCIIGILSLVAGLVCGILFYKLIALLLLRLSHLSVPFGFQIYMGGVTVSLILFGCIFFATLLYNLHQIHLAKPIELLQSKSQGEREPKTRWIMTVAGAAALFGGYYIAITRENPLEVIMLFFLAVILVMIGTYFLFTAGSVAVLKLMRKKKGYYYKTKHFTSVSGMIYRMKQNAVGLANICILSTAVLVMISTTVCLYAGTEDMIRTLYPADINITFRDMAEENKTEVKALVQKAVEEKGQKITKFADYESFSVAAVQEEEVFAFHSGLGSQADVVDLRFVTAEQYKNVTGLDAGIGTGQAAIFVFHGNHERHSFRIGETAYEVVRYLNEEEVEGFVMSSFVMMIDSYLVVLPDQTDIDGIVELQNLAYENNASTYDYGIYMDITGTTEEKRICSGAVREVMKSYSEENLTGESGSYIRTDGRSENEQEMYTMYGGFLFLGIFLGVVFLMATVLIIYYKQISEGYEDKDRFEIMQKVGMSASEVRGSIRSQILKVFFLPLVTAGIHVIVAFPMIKRLLLLFGMTNANLFLLCTIVTIVLFALIYAAVFGFTARAYYKIVK